jgi:hypothetical protein
MNSNPIMSIASPPMPIIVGAPRSGTTLLRLMLDAHPELAIPPETGFLPALAQAQPESSPGLLTRVMTCFPPDAPGWRDFGVSDADLTAAIAATVNPGPADAARCFYRLYAARFGKARWGDKTPAYAFNIPEIEAMLPEAAFIHIIRDGRDAALSLRQLWFAPSQDARALARHWQDFVTAARQGGGCCRRYLELRFEALIADPQPQLRRICDFLALSWHPEMATPHQRAASRLDEHQERRRADGSMIVGRDQRLRQQWRCTVPLDAARIGVWRQADAGFQQAFVTEAGTLLNALGYEV